MDTLTLGGAMQRKISLAYPCGHSYPWTVDDLPDAEAERGGCPLCVGPWLDLEDQERAEEV
jgi:hypothetical protein